MRAIEREPEALDAWLTEVGEAKGENRHLDAAIEKVLNELADLHGIELRARRIASLMATTLQASLLIRHGDPIVADTFAAARLGGDWPGNFGTMPASADLAIIAQRAVPVI